MCSSLFRDYLRSAPRFLAKTGGFLSGIPYNDTASNVLRIFARLLRPSLRLLFLLIGSSYGSPRTEPGGQGAARSQAAGKRTARMTPT